jgi:hypothetical protein
MDETYAIYRLEHLQHTSGIYETFWTTPLKHLHHVQHPRSTFITFIWNNCNISLKHLEHFKHMLTTYAFIVTSLLLRSCITAATPSTAATGIILYWRDSTFNLKKHTYSIYYVLLQTLLTPCWLASLSTKFIDFIDGLADPTTPPLCVSSTVFPGGVRGFIGLKNEHLISLVDLLVGLAMGIFLRYMLRRLCAI